MGNERGMALLITIMVVSLLVAVTLQFSRTMRHSYFSSATLRDSQQLHMAAMSGVNIGGGLLEDDMERNKFDTLQDAWATLEEESLSGLFENEMLTLTVEDLSGKLQVNSLVEHEADQGKGGNGNIANENREILNQLLLSGTFELEGEDAPREIVDALVDWLDKDERESDFGAESGYYRSLDPPYECRNGPVTVIEELLKVKGITAELLYGVDGKPGLADYLTVYGSDGKININTVPITLLQAVEPQISKELAEAMDEHRREEGNYESLEKATWYKAVSAWPGDVTLPDELITTKSRYFMIISDTSRHDLHRQISVVVERDREDGIAELYRKVD